MTDNNATLANEDLHPIQDWENRKVKGQAIACKQVYNSHLAEVAELRNRQEAYEQSFPTDPKEALGRINRVLIDDSNIDGIEYAPRAALTILNELACRHSLDDSGQMNDAVFWLTSQALEGLALTEACVKEAGAISRTFSDMHEPFEA